jgi:hypothetical protein
LTGAKPYCCGWATIIADPKRGESAPAAPIAWNGLVFIGNAGGDVKGVKGRMYALDAETGKIVWEFYLVPKGARDVEHARKMLSEKGYRFEEIVLGSYGVSEVLVQTT